MYNGRHKILFVNDTPDNDRLIEEKLGKASDVFDLVHIQGFNQGLEHLDSREFDAFLIDLGHTNGRGEDVLNKFHDFVKAVPTVVLTDARNESLRIRARRFGAIDYLIKDTSDIDTLLSLVAEFGKTKRALIQSEARYRLLLKAISDYAYTVWIDDGRPVATSHSSGCVAVTGYSSDEYSENPYLWYLMIHEEDREAVKEQADAVLSGKSAYSLEHRIIHKDGRVRWIKNTPVPRIDQRGRLFAYDGLISDITDRKQAEQKLRLLYYYDTLTNLPNRELFSDRLRQTVMQARRHKRMFAVMITDLDRFKGVNESLGYKIGDSLLQQVSERFANVIREGDTIARFGPDEFIFLFPDIARPSDAALIAQNIRNALSKCFLLDGQELFITASIGMSLYPSDGADADALIKNADMAMYQAKAKGRNGYQFYTPVIDADARRKLMLEHNLWKALERNEFALYYQPIVELATGRISGTEALVRWNHPELGMLSPLEFIPIAEETGLIVPIGEWIIENVCMQGKTWYGMGFPPIRVTVNLSMKQFAYNAILKTVLNALEKAALDPGLLELELTESIVIQNADQTIETLHEMKSAGIQIALDDFGIGFSSLSYLKNLPLNRLKLDRSFVGGLVKETKNKLITKGIIGIAHSLGLQVIAEGVETNDQLELLRSWKCDEAQGYLFSRPIPAEEITRLVGDTTTKKCEELLLINRVGGDKPHLERRPSCI